MKISVTLSDDERTATIRLSGKSDPVVVDCLGVEHDDAGQPERVYLNAQMGKKLRSHTYQGWEPSGVYTTVLTRIPG